MLSAESIVCSPGGPFVTFYRLTVPTILHSSNQSVTSFSLSSGDLKSFLLAPQSTPALRHNPINMIQRRFVSLRSSNGVERYVSMKRYMQCTMPVCGYLSRQVPGGTSPVLWMISYKTAVISPYLLMFPTAQVSHRLITWLDCWPPTVFTCVWIIFIRTEHQKSSRSKRREFTRLNPEKRKVLFGCPSNCQDYV